MVSARSALKINDELIVNIALVGDEAVGKTCLLGRFATNKFEEQMEPTMGVMFLQKKIILPISRIHTIFLSLLKKKPRVQEVYLKIWELAGNLKHEQVRNQYYANKEVYMLAFDITNQESFNIIRNYVKKIQEIINDQKIIIVATKCDMEKNRVVSDAEILKLEKELNTKCIKTSAATGKNIDAVFTAAARYSMQSKHANKKPLNKVEQFFSNHWGKMLAGGAIVACVVTLAIITGGLVPAIAGGLIALGITVKLAAILIGVGSVTILGYITGVIASAAIFAGMDYWGKPTTPPIVEKAPGVNTGAITSGLGITNSLSGSTQGMEMEPQGLNQTTTTVTKQHIPTSPTYEPPRISF